MRAAKSVLLQYVILTILVLGLSGCQGHQLQLLRITQTSTVEQVKLDILFVIDISTSLKEEVDAVKEGISVFINALVGSNADFQIAVTSTVIIEQADSAPAQHSGQFLSATGVNNILTSANSTPAEIVADFTATIDFILDPSFTSATTRKACEAILEAAKLATDLSLRPENTAFLRDDADLAIIAIADEEDVSIELPTPKAELDDVCAGAGTPFDDTLFTKEFKTQQEYLDYFTALKIDIFGNSNFSINGIITLAGDVDSCANPDAAPKEEASCFQEAIDATGGFAGSICSTDYSEFLDDLGLQIAALASQIKLDFPADPTSIEVRVDGTLLPTSQVTYNATNTSVNITPAPPLASTVEVSYFVDTDLVDMTLVN